MFIELTEIPIRDKGISLLSVVANGQLLKKVKNNSNENKNQVKYIFILFYNSVYNCTKNICLSQSYIKCHSQSIILQNLFKQTKTTKRANEVKNCSQILKKNILPQRIFYVKKIISFYKILMN